LLINKIVSLRLKVSWIIWGAVMTYIIETITSEWKEIIKRGVWALAVPILSIIYALLNTDRGWVNVIEVSIDRYIPFNKYFIVPYVLWYVYVGFFLMLLCIISERSYRKLLMNLLIGALTCYGIFCVFPTTVPRPIINSQDIFSKIVLIIYNRDNPFNCFPSIHVLNAVLTAIYVNREPKLNRTVKFISTLIAVLIVLSTMFIKQHFFLDVVAATILSYSLYMIAYLIDDKKIIPLPRLNQRLEQRIHLPYRHIE